MFDKVENKEPQIDYEKKYEKILLIGLDKLKKISNPDNFQDYYSKLKLDLYMIENRLSFNFLMSKKVLDLEFKLFSLKSDNLLRGIFN